MSKLSILALFLVFERCLAIGGLQFVLNAAPRPALNIIEDTQKTQTTDDTPVSIYTKDNLPKSFMDLVYGDLVDGDHEREVLAAKLNSGALKPPVADFNNLDAAFSISSAEKSRLKVAKTKFESSKLHLPDKDFADDLWTQRESFNGLLTYANTEAKTCFDKKNLGADDYTFDVAIVGAGFDTATSYRPGARFGPRSIRTASKRLGAGTLPTRGYLNRYIDDHYEFGDEHDVYDRDPLMGKIEVFSDLKVVDCGDVPMTPFDNRIALNQLYRAERLVHKYDVPEKHGSKYLDAPRIITLGGDHTITLLTLKSVYETLGEEITVIHFDSHIDTWSPDFQGGSKSEYSRITHGSFLHFAAERGYLNMNNSMHVGIRGKIQHNGPEEHDLGHDVECGFWAQLEREIDVSGVKGIVDQIKTRIYGTTDFMNSAKKDTPVYITFDIDVLDPVHAPATGTVEPGGFTIREILNILDGLEGMNLVGADLVEVAPIYDNVGETTSLNAAHVVDSFLGLMASYKLRHSTK